MFMFIAISCALGLFVGMFVLLETGRRMGIRRASRDAESGRAGLGAVEGAVFGLMGLLVAFTFSGAAARFDSRRQLVIEEVNAIGTAYLRLDLLPSALQPALRDSFRRYVDSRLAVYRKLPDIQGAMEELARSAVLQNEIWTRAISACSKSDTTSATMLLLPALNQMIDITTTRTMAAQMHPPAVVFFMLVVAALSSSLLAGYGMAKGKRRSWLHIFGFVTLVAVTMYVVIDIEYPRLGLIQIDTFDRAIVELRESMK